MQPIRCDAVDFSGTRCGLQAGHSGQHGAAVASKPGTSFARILVTPLVVIVAALIVGTMLDAVLAALLIGVFVSIAYILSASRR
jgi:hypothetical protein